MISEERVRAIQQRYEALQQALSNPDELPREEYVIASKELAELAPVITQMETFVKLNQEIAELSEIVEDPDSEEEMRDLATSELEDQCNKLPVVEEHRAVYLQKLYRLVGLLPSLLRAHFANPSYTAHGFFR